MTWTQLAAALLLVGGGTTLLLGVQPRRPDLRRRLRVVDGVPPPSRLVVVRAGVAAVVLLAVPAVPVVAAVAGAPVVAVAVSAALVLPAAATIAAELWAAVNRSGMPRRIPLAAQWQRRIVGGLVGRIVALFPAPPLRRLRPRRRSSMRTLTSAGVGRRLLVVPPGHGPQRPWEVAETYLGARSRYRDVLSLNRGRRAPDGTFITEDSRIEAGWTLLMPRDAIGAGLVDLPGDPRVHAGTASVAVLPMPGPDQAPREETDGGQVGEPEPEPDEEPEPAAAEHPPADLPWDLVHARLLADGVRTALLFRRTQQAHDRAFGSTVVPIDRSTAQVDAAAELGADRWGAEALDRVLGRLPRPAPPVVVARLLPDVVELVLAAPAVGPPAPFTADVTGRRWTARRDGPTAGPAAGPTAGSTAGTGGVAPLPGLVSLGRDRAGWVLVDLLAARGPVALRGEVRAARMVATAIGLELLMSRWSAGSRVVMVGFGHAFDGVDPRLVVAARLDDVIDDVVGHIDRNPGVAQFVILADPPSDQQAELLRQLAGAAPVGVLAVGSTGRDSWVFELAGGGVLTCAEPAVAVGAQALSTPTVEALARLLSAETATVASDVDGIALPRPVDPDAVEVVVRLFGEPRIDGPIGPLDADPVTVEIVAFLALHGVASAAEIAAAVFPFGVPESDLRLALKVVVELLESASSGLPGLLEYDDGRLELTSDVHADWHLFVALDRAGRVAEALDLPGLAGPADAAAREPARYGWLTGVHLARQLPGHVADVAHRMVTRRREEGRPDLAAVAASSGLRSQPFSGLLRQDLRSALDALSRDRLGEPVGHR